MVKCWCLRQDGRQVIVEGMVNTDEVRPEKPAQGRRCDAVRSRVNAEAHETTKHLLELKI